MKTSTPERKTKCNPRRETYLFLASKLPTFKGDETDAQQLDTFLVALRRYFRVNQSSYAVDPEDKLKLASIAQCFP